MSQYPSPYSPPPVDFNYYQPAHGPSPAAPAKRAGVLLIALGVLGMACGLCCGLGIWAVPADQLLEQLRKSGMQLNVPPGTDFTAEQLLRIGYTVIGGLSLLAGVLLVVLGYFVRRGSRGASIAALLIAGLLLLGIVANVLGTAAFNPGTALAGVCVSALPLALVGWAVIWLIQALRARPQLTLEQQQYMAMYWQYQQQYATYSQAGYAQPPAPPVVPGPPSQGYSAPQVSGGSLPGTSATTPGTPAAPTETPDELRGDRPQ